MSPIAELAARQLDAYNNADLDAFVACYHEDVQVFHGDDLSLEGKSEFRNRYQTLFMEWTFGASVPQRMHVGGHCVDFEIWWRIDPTTAERSEGELLVRYQEKDGLIGLVQFLR